MVTRSGSKQNKGSFFILLHSVSGVIKFFSQPLVRKNPLVLRNFLLAPKYFSNCISFGQVANTTISYSKCNSNQTVVDEGNGDL